ncbi:MAG: hypothetical protein QOK21_4469 [Solirubrobacteraceae bacterium]|jgi:hypothetical protein|nr:hypothetical protein [Solirubrobacteraceae bacterium]
MPVTYWSARPADVIRPGRATQDPLPSAMGQWTVHETRRACLSCGVHSFQPTACANCGGRTLPLAEIEEPPHA